MPPTFCSPRGYLYDSESWYSSLLAWHNTCYIIGSQGQLLVLSEDSSHPAKTVTPVKPQYPFEHICMDYMSKDGHNYGVFVDRFTNWAGVFIGAYAAYVETVMARLCEDYGVPVTCSTDGRPQYMAEVVKKFMGDYRIHHRLCSVANPHASGKVLPAPRHCCSIATLQIGTQACPQLWHCLAVLCMTSCHVCQEQWLVQCGGR